MKKFICLLLACTLVFSLCACGKDDQKDTNDNDANIDSGVADQPDSAGKNDFETVGTRDARTKTCLANQREIQAQFNNNAMSGILQLQIGDTYELRTNENGTDGEWVYTGPNNNDQTETVYLLFQDAPYCPVDGNFIKVTVERANITNSEVENFKIIIECCGEHETHSRTE